MDKRRLDLHLHTTASDGRLTPTELVLYARQHRLDAIAITDHDTTAGIAEAQAAASGVPVIIPGIELSTVDDGGDVHMLGYFIDIDNISFQETLQEFRNTRDSRARKIVERLAELNMPVAWDQVEEIAQGGAIGRPHIARAMVQAGHVATISEAFEKYLYTGGPAYVARQRLTPDQGVELIHSAGGAAVLAHPGLVQNYEPLLERLVCAGLDGVEIMHPNNPEPVRTRLWALAERYNLVPTGGSDFHYEERGPIASVVPPEGCIEMLQAQARQHGGLVL